MSYLNIAPGISTLTDAGRPLSQDPGSMTAEIKADVLARDDHTCRYCGFQSKKYQEVNYTGDGTQNPPKADSYATACVFCHQCFHLDRIAYMQSGTLIWAPELSQSTLNNICRAVYVARITQGAIADMARATLDTLLKRKDEAKRRLGTDNPKILASILQDFLESKEYASRKSRLKGFLVLPLDRRIIREGDLEFNQFPQILAYWRSKDGPYGDVPPRKWAKLFYETREQVK